MASYNSTALIVDDHDPRINFSSGWDPMVSSAAEYDSTKTGASSAGVTASFTFTGAYTSSRRVTLGDSSHRSLTIFYRHGYRGVRFTGLNRRLRSTSLHIHHRWTIYRNVRRTDNPAWVCCHPCHVLSVPLSFFWSTHACHHKYQRHQALCVLVGLSGVHICGR